MSIYVLLTRFDPPQHVSYAKGYWYRTGYGRYSAEWIEDSLMRELEDNVTVYEDISLPGIGAYIGEYENLYPCFIKLSDITDISFYVKEIQKRIYLYRIHFHGNLIEIPSRMFIDVLEYLNLRPDNKLFVKISIED